MAYREKRRFPRAKADISVRFGWDETCALAGRVVNLSEGGCLLATEELAVRDTPVYVRGLLRDDAVLEGRVSYPLEGIGVGVAFCELSDGAREWLRVLVRINVRAPG